MPTGAPEAGDSVRPLLAPLRHGPFGCGAVPGAPLMKSSVNLTLVTLAGAVSRTKAPEPPARDFAVQAAAPSPLLDVCRALYDERVTQGHGGQDMVAVVRAPESRTEGSAAARTTHGATVTRPRAAARTVEHPGLREVPVQQVLEGWWIRCGAGRSPGRP
ncbi:hypothetical protein [Streptomyces sp. NPDC093094]|uniref:hypothetical protein n=1 Tax=Streptomyces sp. NPDC093094 TaxID=3366026 RepID=UPI0037F3E2E2